MENIIPITALSIPESTDVSVRPKLVREYAEALEKLGDKAKVALAAAWKEIRDGNYWESYGFQSFDSYVFETFGYGKSTSSALIGVYETYITKLGFFAEEIAEVSWHSLVTMKPHITESNAKDFLERMKNMKQKEVKAWAKELAGLHPSESKAKTGNRFTFNCEAEEQADVIREALSCAETASGSPIPTQNLEFICADFLLDHLDDPSNEDLLAEWVARLEGMFKIKITYEKIGE
jgi:hypothetical protein